MRRLPAAFSWFSPAQKPGSAVYCPAEGSQQRPEIFRLRPWSKGINPLLQQSEGDLLAEVFPRSPNDIVKNVSGYISPEMMQLTENSYCLPHNSTSSEFSILFIRQNHTKVNYNSVIKILQKC